MSAQPPGGPYPPPPPGGWPPGPPTPVPLSPADERTWATLAHLGGIFFSLWPSLILLLILGKRSAFVDDQTKEALNFQLTVLIASLVSAVLVLLLIGILLLIAVLVLDVVFCILAGIAASRGEPYRYPLAIRMVT